MQMIGGGIGLLVTGFLLGEYKTMSVEKITALPIIGIVYLTIGGSVIAFSIYNWLLWSAPTTLVSTYAYITPIVAVILGVVILQETISTRLIIATIMILTAVAVVTLSSGVKSESEEYAGSLKQYRI
jgi:drug/metabolite transporter (DMT)-like permease